MQVGLLRRGNQRVAALRIEIVFISLRETVDGGDVHFAPHAIDVLLGFLDHLDRFVPLFLKGVLGLLYFHFLHVYPSINYVLLDLVGPRRELIGPQLFLDLSLLFLFTIIQAFFTELNQLQVLIVLQDVINVVLGKILERVAIEHRV